MLLKTIFCEAAYTKERDIVSYQAILVILCTNKEFKGWNSNRNCSELNITLVINILKFESNATDLMYRSTTV